MTDAMSAYAVEERIVQGDTRWVAIRARGAEWSWLTADEAASIGRHWVEQFGEHRPAAPANTIAATRS